MFVGRSSPSNLKKMVFELLMGIKPATVVTNAALSINVHEYLQVFMCKILVLLNSIINVLGCRIGSTNVELAP